jgi:hypothetical protein
MDLRSSTGRWVLAALAMAALSAPVSAGAETDAEREREEVREQQEAVEADIDVLEATDAEITSVLDDLDAAIASQQRAVTDAEAAAEDAEDAVRAAESDLRAARRDVVVLERAIAEMAVASFMHPPTADLVQSLQADSISEALLQRTYLDARAKRDLDLLGLLEDAETKAAEQAVAVEVAATEAAAAVEAAGAALAGLRSEEARQQSFAADLQDRIDASLAEAAVLADMDADLAAEIQAEQAALIARIPPPPVVVPTAVEDDVPAAPATPTTPSAPTTTPSAPTAPVVTAPPPVSTTTPPLRTVQGITVHADIADDVDAMLTAARADGISLSGWGYRSTERQIELRIANCGPTYYDIWIRPASTCNPPTAVPGRSLHEQGRAIDFTSGGSVISTRSSPAFQWLADNAASYGLFNLPSEPWHWSTTGG